MKAKTDKKDDLENKKVTQDELLAIRLNPNVLTDFNLAGDPEVYLPSCTEQIMLLALHDWLFSQTGF